MSQEEGRAYRRPTPSELAMQAPRVAGVVGRGLPLGPALTYALTVWSAPYVV